VYQLSKRGFSKKVLDDTKEEKIKGCHLPLVYQNKDYEKFSPTIGEKYDWLKFFEGHFQFFFFFLCQTPSLTDNTKHQLELGIVQESEKGEKSKAKTKARGTFPFLQCTSLPLQFLFIPIKRAMENHFTKGNSLSSKMTVSFPSLPSFEVANPPFPSTKKKKKNFFFLGFKRVSSNFPDESETKFERNGSLLFHPGIFHHRIQYQTRTWGNSKQRWLHSPQPVPASTSTGIQGKKDPIMVWSSFFVSG